MRLFRTAAVLALAASLAGAEGNGAQALFEKAWAAQDGKKDWAGAHEIYDKILESHEAERSLLARVIFERGVCAVKLGKPEDAAGDFNGVCSEFEDEVEWCAKVSLCLHDLPMISVVDLVAIQTGVEWTIQGGRIVFALQEEMNGRKRPAAKADPEMDEFLKGRLDDARVSLQADSENPNRVIEYLRLATRLPFVAGTALMTNREWRHKPAAAEWKDKPVVEALASLGLKARIVNRVILVEPER